MVKRKYWRNLLEAKLKHRIIGVIVVAAIAIIFIPVLFKNNNNLPPQPVVITEDAPSAPQKPSPAAIAQQNQAQIAATTTSAPKENNGNTTESTAQNVATAPKPNPSPTAPANVMQIQPLTNSQMSQQSENNAVAKVDAVEQKTLVENTAPTSTTIAPTPKPKLTPVTKKSADNNSTDNNSKQKVAALEAQSLAAETTLSQMPTTQANLATPNGSAWVIQLGSFSNQTNATSLVQQLQTHGFNAYMRKSNTHHGVLTRVLIGPETQRAKAQDILNQLNQKMHLKGVIVPYIPV